MDEAGVQHMSLHKSVTGCEQRAYWLGLERAAEAAERRRAMPSSMPATALGHWLEISSNAPYAHTCLVRG